MSHQLDNMSDDLDMNEAMPPMPAADMEDEFPQIAEFEVGKEANVTADGGVTKKVLVAGTGDEKPEAGDEVTVHYVGTLLDGTEFDSSRKRGDPFVFELGKGKVIKGWDEGVATMLRGEKAVLTCRPEYAYGKSGSGGTIPPDATLKFEVELLSWKSSKDISPNGDGSLIKIALEEGEGWDNPKPRDEVLVRYSARVKGEEKAFASSPESGLEFVLSAGHLIEALPIALKTMKKGAKVQLQVQPQLAFGAAGSAELGVPPNAAVEVDLELLGWKKVEEVTEDGLVVKKTLATVETSDWKRPNDGANVTITYVARLPDGTLVDEHGADSPVKFVTDEGQLISGLEQAVMKMKRGETALVTMPAQYAYGAEGFTGTAGTVPPNSDVHFEVTLVEFENTKEDWEMSDEEKVAAAKAKKDKGNAAYGAGNLERATKMYDKAVGSISYDNNFSDAIKAEAKEVKKSCWSNLAQVYLKKGEWKKVVSSCDKVLELDPRHVKALHRRAQAYLATQDFIEAERDLKAALEVEPKNASLGRTLRELKAAMREANKKEAALYGKMFKALGKLSTGAAPPQPDKAADMSGVMELLSGEEKTPAAPVVEATA